MTIPSHQAKAFPSETTQNLLRASFICVVGFLVFFPSLQGGWLMDDDFYITHHPLLHDPAHLWKIWFQPGSFIEYYPIEQTVQWLQWQLWQDTPLGYHLTNVFLHLASALLVWRLLSKFGLKQAWIGGLLFAVHPVVVESVAWMSELKNTLSLPPFLLAMCFYLDYEATGRKRDYQAALLFFIVAMLCKIALALFPLVILLFAWWKRGRIGWNDLKASAPFGVVTFVLVLTAFLTSDWYHQLHTAPEDPIPLGGLLSRLALAGLTISFYFFQCVLPMKLLFIYPQWDVNPPTLAQFLPWPAFAGLFLLLWAKRKSWGRHILLGLGFFLINIAPFTGLLAISYMSFTWVMDHFLYIPLIGVIGLAVAGWEVIAQRFFTSAPVLCMAGLAAVITMLVFESFNYSQVFVNQETLWSYTIRHNPKAWLAHNNLGQVRLDQGRTADAIAEYQQALLINPNLTGPHINLGNIFKQMGQYQDAIDEYQKALAINPHDAKADNNWGNTLSEMGQYQAAIEHYRAAIQSQPNYVQAHVDLGVALIQGGDQKGGVAEYETALSLQPTNADAHYNLGIFLGQSGQMEKAVDEFEKAARLNPDDASTHFNLAVALTRTGRIPEAIAQYEEVLRLNPQSAAAATNLAQLKRMNP